MQNQTYKKPFEIIFVDSSIDRTVEIVREQFPKVELIHLPQKTDPGTARNLGIKRAHGELLLFIDSDCIASPNWIQRMVDGHIQNPDLSALGGAVIPAEINIVSFAGYMAEFREFIPEQKKKYTWHIPTLNISYKKSVFDRYGYFDPNYYPQEDLIFNYRLVEQGAKILFDPEIEVTHQFRERLADFTKHQQKIGAITARVLKVIPLPGYQIARNPVLFFIIWPILPMIKFVRTLAVFWQYQRKTLMKNFQAVFILKLGLIYWIYGFARGVLIKNSDLS